MTNRNVRVVLPALTLLVAGCAANTDDSDKPDLPKPEAGDCREALGPAGTAWLKDHVKDLRAKDFSGDTLKDARRFFYRQSPGSAGDARTANLCEFNRFPLGKSPQSFRLKFTASPSPFDDDLIKKLRNKPNTAVTLVNSEVLLLQSEQEGGKPTRYGVFVKCQVVSDSLDKSSGSAMPLEGMMEDSVTGDKSSRTHMKHLLYAAKTMTKTLDCRNNPTFPDEPPASVE